ncbi:copper chaperone PCu(A)C [Candidatus Protofrankia californiensis]|uniref:copper chaperone PCu(A)C n=1 Tax=Candidatus Protofrankia californiensis TaxID=1839754 RepID=UPI0013EBC52F|nr:copper chaperone PCu(A)C [Candidatus Protofrankia californiensis]
MRVHRSLIVACLIVALGVTGCATNDSRSAQISDLPTATSTVQRGRASQGPITIADARVVPAGAGTPTRIYLTIRNDGAVADTVTAVRSNVSAETRLERGGTDARSSPLDMLPVPARGTVALTPGGVWVALPGAAPLIIGGTVVVTFTLARAGQVDVFTPIEPSGVGD